MNYVTLIGRLTRDPDIRYTQGQDAMCIARYTLAVNRREKDKDGNSQADFISCIAFRKTAEFAERYLRKGVKIAVEGQIRTDSYTNKDGQKVYTTDVIVSSHEFCEKLGDAGQQDWNQQSPREPVNEGFMSIPDDVEDEGLPFN